jgi:hypothetical protein
MKDFKSRLLQELKRDKKRAAVLALLAVVGLIVVGRLVLKQVGSAAAKDSPPPVAASDPSVANRGWQPGGRETRHDDYLTQIDTTIKRDIFAPPDQYFPPVAAPKKEVAIVNGQTMEKAEKEIIEKDAAAMTVESTILSSIPKAIINGQLVQVGDTMNGFRIVEIASRRVTLERNGVTVTLEMKSEP